MVSLKTENVTLLKTVFLVILGVLPAMKVLSSIFNFNGFKKEAGVY
jgi:hypothetical protein